MEKEDPARLLPTSMAMSKEMLPIVDKPAIQYIVETVEAGIKVILIVIGNGKHAIKDQFDNAFELEDNLIRMEKFCLLEKVQFDINFAAFTFTI